MLHLHRAERADVLIDAVTSILREPLDDPFAPEVVAVPTRGVERWLTQRLSLSLGARNGHDDGVCANVEFPFPGRLVGDAMAAVTGIRREDDEWLPGRLVWPLLEVVDATLDEPWLAAVAGHLRGGSAAGGAEQPDRRFGTIRHFADLFDRYGVHRPAMIAAWAGGRDVDGHGEALPTDAAWQPALWRRLRDAVATPSPAERLPSACARIEEAPASLELPPRVSLFGLTRLPTSYLDVLRALASARDVHLFLLHPSPALWSRIEARGEPRSSRVARGADRTAELPHHPLLATWGQDAREMQLVMAAGAVVADRHHVLADEGGTLLGQIQDDIRADRAPAAAAGPGAADGRLLLGSADRSVQVHACHGKIRQVEVLRDAILHLLADDPSLQPRDIIVMCPDIDAYSPLIQAVFGLGGADLVDEGEHPSSDAPVLSVRLADRSLRQTNPVLAAASELLRLADTRLTASQVIDFASREPVRRRFRLDDDDLARVEEWVTSSGIRWGLDAAHRAPFKLQAVGANTWRSGLDRLLLGVAMTEEDLPLVGSVLPLDDVDSGDIDLAGRLSELIDRLQVAIDDMAEPMPIDGWSRALAAAADSLLATRPVDGWQRAQFGRVLDEVVGGATVGGSVSTTPLTLADVRALLADRLRGRPTRANFRTGHLTMCTLVPMRSVPHRVVCVLGLDDGVFPRRTAPDGDDLLRAAPCVGDPDDRREDRQLLLDALLAATETFLVTYEGRDERTNASRPPAVPLGELLDVVDATARTTDERPARAHVMVQHPLQPFDARNFTAGALRQAGPWSFDAVALAGARVAAGSRIAPRPFLGEPLPPRDGDLIELDDLVQFVQHPVRAFLRQRLELGFREVDVPSIDAVPVELDFLEQWGVGQRMLEARLAGVDEATAWRAELSRGELPPGELGAEVLDRVAPTVERLLTSVRQLFGEHPDRASRAVSVELADGRALVGTIADLIDHRLTSVTYSRLGPKHRLGAWVRLLALTASEPLVGYRSIAVGRARRGGKVGVASVGPLSETAALHQLSIIVDLYDRGMREPLPLYTKTSAAYAEAVMAGRNARWWAEEAWVTKPDGFENEDRELVHQTVLGGVVPFGSVLEPTPRDDERGPGWSDDEPTRFGRLALRLWEGLLVDEEVTSR